MQRLRPYQLQLKQNVYAAWREGNRNVLAVAPTGGGKTVSAADILAEYSSASAIIAHRGELVGQLSLALAREGVRHRIIGPDSLRRTCVALHMDELGRSLHDVGGRVGVCGVDTLVKREVSQDSWFRNVGLWAQDEAHHVQKENKWGTAAAMFPNAYGLGFTATPGRADGRGLGAHNDGLFHTMVMGPTPRELIDAGYLTDYRIFAPPSDVDYSSVTVTSTGDYSPAKLRAAVHASGTIVGDIVKHYLRIAQGRKGITFAVDVEAAQEIARAFRGAGIAAEVVSAKTPDALRAQVLRRFRAGEVRMLVNVDLFGEGFDVPACEVVIMARKTESFPLYAQQFGRVLRVLVGKELADVWDAFTDEQRRAHIAASGKPCGIIIDHVGNVIRHGLPDARREWSLDRREGRSKGVSDAIPLRACLNPVCAGVYERYLRVCPYCGHYPEPPSRLTPDAVDGDLYELDAATLAALRGVADKIDAAPFTGHLDPKAARGLQNVHYAVQVSQAALRQIMALWAGWKQVQGHTEQECYRLFYYAYGMDVMSAKGLREREAMALTARIQETLTKHGVIAA